MWEKSKTVLFGLDKRHLQIGLAVLSLALFVLGAGAPGADGGGQ